MAEKRVAKAGAKSSDRRLSLAEARRLEGHIQELRGVQVVLDRDLASIDLSPFPRRLASVDHGWRIGSR